MSPAAHGGIKTQDQEAASVEEAPLPEIGKAEMDELIAEWRKKDPRMENVSGFQEWVDSVNRWRALVSSTPLKSAEAEMDYADLARTAMYQTLMKMSPVIKSTWAPTEKEKAALPGKGVNIDLGGIWQVAMDDRRTMILMVPTVTPFSLLDIDDISGQQFPAIRWEDILKEFRTWVVLRESYRGRQSDMVKLIDMVKGFESMKLQTGLREKQSEPLYVERELCARVLGNFGDGRIYIEVELPVTEILGQTTSDGTLMGVEKLQVLRPLFQRSDKVEVGFGPGTCALFRFTLASNETVMALVAPRTEGEGEDAAYSPLRYF